MLKHMKKGVGILSLFFLFSFCLKSEKIDLCYAIDILSESAQKSFSDLTLHSIDSSSNYICYASKLEIFEAQETYIEKTTKGVCHLFADFGYYKNIEDAILRINQIKSNALGCNNHFEIDIIQEIGFNFPSLYFKKTSEQGFRLYEAHLGIQKIQNAYAVFLNIPAKNAYTDYIYVKEKKTEDKFSKEVRAIIGFASNDFKEIQGELLSTYTRPVYKSKFNISDAVEFYIDYSNEGAFVIKTSSRLTEKEALVELAKNIELISKAIGSEYAILLCNKHKVKFINIIEKPTRKNLKIAICVEIERKLDDTFDCIIQIPAKGNK